MARTIVLLGSWLFLLPSFSQEYMPFPTADISEDQWQTYYDQVMDCCSRTERRYDERGLVTFSKEDERLSFAFTLPSHPAHPAWITRQVVFAHGQLNMQQVGYFAGNEEEFAKQFAAYQELTEQTIRSMPDGPRASEMD